MCRILARFCSICSEGVKASAEPIEDGEWGFAYRVKVRNKKRDAELWFHIPEKGTKKGKKNPCISEALLPVIVFAMAFIQLRV